MNSRVRALWVLLLTVAVFQNLGCESPQSDYSPPDDIENSYYSPGWAVGHWTRYDYTVSGLRSSIYIAITDRETNDGVTYFWVETVKSNGTVTVATRQLVTYSERSPFLKANGALLPGAKRYITKTGYSSPAEITLSEGNTSPVIDIEKLFGGGEKVDTISIDENAEYRTKSGKDMVCSRKILIFNDVNVGTVLLSRYIPITGIAFSSGKNRELELVDFGFSGADSLF